MPRPTCVFTQFETAGGDMHVTGYQTCYGGERRKGYHGNHFPPQTTNVYVSLSSSFFPSNVFFVSCLRRHQRPCLSTGNGVLRAFMSVFTLFETQAATFPPLPHLLCSSEDKMGPFCTDEMVSEEAGDVETCLYIAFSTRQLTIFRRVSNNRPLD